jgi:small subunit ribosomal protein S2
MSDEVKSDDAQEVATETPAVDTAEALRLEEMARAGIIYGRKKSKTHPRMRKFIFATRNGFEVFDLPKTTEAIETAKKFVRGVVENRGLVLLVGTIPAAKELILGLAKQTDFPYVTERWLGGTITNYKTLSKRIDYYKQLKADKASGRLEKYTKKERVLIDRQIEKMTKLFGGLENLTRMPDLVFVADVTKHDTAIREAKKMKIPVVGIANSDADPDAIDYSIPGNTNSQTSLKWIISQLNEAFTAPQKPKELPKEKNDQPKEETPVTK